MTQNLKLNFAKDAYNLLEETTDCDALRKLALYYLEEIKSLSVIASNYEKQKLVIDHFKTAQEILEKELISYKLKFDEISKKMDESGYIKSPLVKRFEKEDAFDQTKDIIWEKGAGTRVWEEEGIPEPEIEHPIETTTPIKVLNLDVPFVSIKKKIENLSDALKENLTEFSAQNKAYLKSFTKVAPFIQEFASDIIKKNRASIQDGIKIERCLKSVPGLKSILLFDQILPENGKESILSFTKVSTTIEGIENYLDGIDSNEILESKDHYALVPQSVVEQILNFSESNYSYSSAIIKEIKSIIEKTVLKVGVKKYWLLQIVQEISKVKDKFLNESE